MGNLFASKSTRSVSFTGPRSLTLGFDRLKRVKIAEKRGEKPHDCVYDSRYAQSAVE
jgi:hypothetical protein